MNFLSPRKKRHHNKEWIIIIKYTQREKEKNYYHNVGYWLPFWQHTQSYYYNVRLKKPCQKNKFHILVLYSVLIYLNFKPFLQSIWIDLVYVCLPGIHSLSWYGSEWYGGLAHHELLMSLFVKHQEKIFSGMIRTRTFTTYHTYEFLQCTTIFSGERNIYVCMWATWGE